ncbi:MAG: DNA-directed RNA polymerase subunit alpha [bacterium]
MENISLPDKIKYEKGAGQNETKLIIEPCYPGYGTTIGNALRRVLLSSLCGGAVVAIKIKGCSHEFSTIPNVKEDAVELILNFKKLRVDVKSQETVILKLKVKGKKEVKASDITKNAEVSISNPDFVLANLTSKDAELEMDIHVRQGRGYTPIEEREHEEKSVGLINIDSIFTPIRNISINVENVRVGRMTNYDKLIMTIGTDGSIDPKDAVKQASEILIDHFKLLV